MCPSELLHRVGRAIRITSWGLQRPKRRSCVDSASAVMITRVIRLAAALCALGLCAGAATAYVVTRPDPKTQAQADGCPRDLPAIFKREAPTWVYVSDRDA